LARGNSATIATLAQTTATIQGRNVARCAEVISLASSAGTDNDSATRASPMAWRRMRGSFVKQRRNNSRTAAGVPDGNASKLGSFVMTNASVSEAVSPANRRWPVSISNNTTPNAQISARRSTGFPLACSGDM